VWALPSCRRRKERKKTKYWVHKVFRATEEKWEFHTLFERLKDDRQNFFSNILENEFFEI
jgi:hypothetical protein